MIRWLFIDSLKFGLQTNFFSFSSKTSTFIINENGIWCHFEQYDFCCWREIPDLFIFRKNENNKCIKHRMCVDGITNNFHKMTQGNMEWILAFISSY